MIQDLWNGNIEGDALELSQQLKRATQVTDSDSVCTVCSFVYRDQEILSCPRCGACRNCEHD